MNKNGQLWSITGVLLVIVLVVLMQTSVSTIQEIESSQVQRAQSHTFDAFVYSFENLDKQRILQRVSQQLTDQNRLNQEVIDSAVNENISVLANASPYIQDMSVKATLVDVQQVSLQDIQIEYDVYYEASSQKIQVNASDTVFVTVTIQNHPEFGPVGDTWQEREGPLCLGSRIYDDTVCNDTGELVPQEQIED